ncbi:family 1 glycosylhydrolase [Olsenella uli]|uniref:family 1 glycosylhydrolase n=1 Tax=Olsenella uli TaxID=133926 RepID=UPI003D799482
MRYPQSSASLRPPQIFSWNTGLRKINSWNCCDIAAPFVGGYVGRILSDLFEHSATSDRRQRKNAESAVFLWRRRRGFLHGGATAELECFVNLYHFDMPAYLFRRGGWENREVVEAYANYAEKAFRAFGKEIRCWFTFNEPIVEPDQRYQNGVWYPCLHNFNRAKAVQYNISIAHSLAVAAYRRAKADGCMLDDSRIGLINCFTPPYTRENPSEADLEAVRMTDGINNCWWLDLVTEGKLPADILADFAARGVELPVRPGDEQILAQGKVDWLGCNYYHPERVQVPSRDVDEAGCPVFAEP